MGMPEYLRRLREKVGHDLLFLPSVACLIRDSEERILLVKHVEPPPGPLSAHELVANGMVDPAFPRFLRASGAEAFIAGPAEYAAAALAMRNGEGVGARIESH